MHRSNRVSTVLPVSLFAVLLALPCSAVEAELQGLSLGVSDVPRAVAFYKEALGLEVVSSDRLAAILELDGFQLVLHRSGRRAAGFHAARVYLNLTVDDLDGATRRVVEAGGSVHPGGPVESAVGPFFTLQDPDGHPMDLIDHPWDDGEAHDSPVRLFNLGMNVIEKEPYEEFFAALGIGVSTRDYLPTTLVMEPRGAAQIVLHDASETAAEDADRGTLIFVTGAALDPEAVRGLVRAESGLQGSWLELESPSGTPVRVYAKAPPGDQSGLRKAP